MSAGATITATLDSLDGVSSVAWSIATTDDTGQAADYPLVTSGLKGSVCTTTALTAGTAAILKCTVNGGINPLTNTEDTDNLIKTVKFVVLTSGGHRVGCTGEQYEDDPLHGTAALQNAAIRAASTAIASYPTIRVPLAAGSFSAAVDDASPFIVGTVPLRPITLAPGATEVMFRAVIETSSVSNAVYVDLYDYEGITNGGVPTVVAGSELSSTSLGPDLVEVDLTDELLNVATEGLLQLRMWMDPLDEEEQTTCSFAAIDLTP